ncbi:GAF domain-containing protein [Ulvibacter antarcticus]|uniref:GAF domain-containing protein n=1 Tax=Ulvibacter antarcticus TaxID=442714 RepID=A0A3L9YE08_9FLAO|nr:GAF domain-containing protein [Ulvibacter antarcticus]RMA58933.1 hypothetical protein BXY75_2315 [Ulvibacter antarcticus]
MRAGTGDFPLKIKISFEKLFDHYRSLQNGGSILQQDRAHKILEVAEKFPKLTSGIYKNSDFIKYQEEIDFILEDVFSEALTLNEIKVATTPFNEHIFKSTQRFKNIMNTADKKFDLELNNFDKDSYYILGCSLILNFYYGYKIDFRRPYNYSIPSANGLTKNYKVLFNADFVSIEKTAKAEDIKKEDLDLLLESFDNIEIWKEKFPPGSWIFKGFIIANMFDVTQDASISEFKTSLLQKQSQMDKSTEDFERIFRSIFNIEGLKIGFTGFNIEEEVLEKEFSKNVPSYILNAETEQPCKEALCEASYETLFRKNELYIVTDAEKYHKLYPDNVLYEKLVKQGIRSAIFAAIVAKNELMGILELVSPVTNELNTVNANKLKDVMPFLIDSILRSKEYFENELELIIQEECTAIHPSVHWKFNAEAKRYFIAREQGKQTYFKEIVFENVYPLYGQIDIKGSSEARNDATIKDLLLQMEQIKLIVKKIADLEPLPIYDQIIFRVELYLKDLQEVLAVDSERKVLTFIRKEIIPLFNHLGKKNKALEDLVEEYYELIDRNTGLVYKHRKNYDDSVMLINKRMAAIIDSKQLNAQKMYPHFFERFKTDGVEHNMYIGEAITKHKTFHKIYLYNLRLWQLQVMCEMENDFYRIKKELPVPLDAASMILSFNSSLSLRFRMDEKRFDVDGTYNARYEVVKKRVDKANIKGTEERITQPGKISIIYSQKEDELEYLKYIAFLQHQKILNKDVEIVELEDLQGVTGLKAIRVSVLYSKGEERSKKYYTYDDLLSQLND